MIFDNLWNWTRFIFYLCVLWFVSCFKALLSTVCVNSSLNIIGLFLIWSIVGFVVNSHSSHGSHTHKLWVRCPLRDEMKNMRNFQWTALNRKPSWCWSVWNEASRWRYDLHHNLVENMLMKVRPYRLFRWIPVCEQDAGSLNPIVLQWSVPVSVLKTRFTSIAVFDAFSDQEFITADHKPCSSLTPRAGPGEPHVLHMLMFSCSNTPDDEKLIC